MSEANLNLKGNSLTGYFLDSVSKILTELKLFKEKRIQIRQFFNTANI
jgi:hypothetical protein